MSKRNFGKSKTAVVVDPTQVPINIDVSTYFSPLIPEEIKICVPQLHKITIEITRDVLQVVLRYLKGQEISNEIYSALQKRVNTVEDVDCGVILTGLYSIIRVGVRQKTKLSIINADLRKMNVPEPIVDDIVRVIKVSRFDVEHCALTQRIRFPKLDKLRWRVDVVISSGSLSRVMRPSLMMQVIYIYVSHLASHNDFITPTCHILCIFILINSYLCFAAIVLFYIYYFSLSFR